MSIRTPKLPHRIKVGNKFSHVNLFPIRFPGKGRTERSHKYTIQDRYSTVPEQLTARHRTVNIGSREQPGVAQS